MLRNRGPSSILTTLDTLNGARWRRDRVAELGALVASAGDVVFSSFVGARKLQEPDWAPLAAIGPAAGRLFDLLLREVVRLDPDDWDLVRVTRVRGRPYLGVMYRRVPRAAAAVP